MAIPDKITSSGFSFYPNNVTVGRKNRLRNIGPTVLAHPFDQAGL